MTRFKRVVMVTLSLGLIGALVGAVLGGLSMFAFTAATGNLTSGATDVVAVAAGVSAALGFVLSPVAAWTLMRHVPIWRAIVETAIGTAIGALVGFALARPTGLRILSPLIFGVVGFILAAARLRFARRARPPVNDPTPPAA